MKTMEMSLEDIFLKITMGEGVDLKDDNNTEASAETPAETTEEIVSETTENTETQDNEKEGEK